MQLLPILHVTERVSAPIDEVRSRLEANTEIWVRNSKTFGNETQFNGFVKGDEFRLNIKHSFHFCRGGPVIGNGKLREENGNTVLSYLIWPGVFTSLFNGVLVVLMAYGLIAQTIQVIEGNFSFGIVFYVLLSVFLVLSIYCAFNPRAVELREAIHEVASVCANKQRNSDSGADAPPPVR